MHFSQLGRVNPPRDLGHMGDTKKKKTDRSAHEQLVGFVNPT